MSVTAVELSGVTNASSLWQEIVDACAHSWIWHTWKQHEFNLCAGKEYGAIDRSFFIFKDGKAIGVVPLIIQERKSADFNGREAAYYSGFLPWPCIKNDSVDVDIEYFAFTELERRAKESGAQRIKVRLTPPLNTGNEESHVHDIADRHGYEVTSFDDHFTEVTPELLRRVRSRYDYKHFSPFFTLSVAKGTDVTAELEECYFKLHVLDAGGQFRSRESYTKMADQARVGEGFYVVATSRKTGLISGMALINVYKGVAYYGSVAVDPSMSKYCIGYQLQCRAVEELLAMGTRHYDLGPMADSKKGATTHEKNISLFKAKISATGSRSMYAIQKMCNDQNIC